MVCSSAWDLPEALAADPGILLMDEPFSALDPLIRRGLQDEFLALSRTMDKTTVFITHDLDEAMRMGSRIGIMRDGEMVQIGTPEDIIIHPKDDYVARLCSRSIAPGNWCLPTGSWSSRRFMKKPMAALPMRTPGPQAHPKADLNSLVESDCWDNSAPLPSAPTGSWLALSPKTLC